MSIREYEAAMITPPLCNPTGGMKVQANVVVSNAGNTQSLSGLFGGALGAGHFLTVKADGAKVYIKFASNDQGTTDAFATGNGPNVVWPLADGESMSVVPISGREVASGGHATLCNYNFLHARVASGGVATGYLRLYRSSLGPTQDPGVEFKFP
jgi:hypothetical protein